MPVDRHLLWRMTHHLNRLRRSNRLAASISRFSREPRINETVIPVDGEREGTPLLMHIHVSGSSGLSVSFRTYLVSDERGKTSLPIQNRLMSEDPTALTVPSRPHHASSTSSAAERRTTRRTISLGYASKLKGVLVRSLKV